MSFVRTIGIPMLDAATSSSRSAIHARPRRESRRRKLTNSTIRASPRATKYHERRSSDVNGSTNGRSILSTGVIPCLPLVKTASQPSSATPGILPRVASQIPPIRIWSPLAAIRPMISPKASVTTAM